MDKDDTAKDAPLSNRKTDPAPIKTPGRTDPAAEDDQAPKTDTDTYRYTDWASI
ncbi:MAG: hypothetical protein HKO95_13455 [Rhodobacteraceae bacterium]|nr:hypothetical protein [Alphaproteobacteria bacterium]MBT8477140.1 hypothetical protein [Alphaproteobacteria bacterium]NNF71647.1 hypothetical protein [Paracoccaceae bacterium]NNK67729.1 hypothetical protein [Paracoccaceae bacterium]